MSSILYLCVSNRLKGLDSSALAPAFAAATSPLPAPDPDLLRNVSNYVSAILDLDNTTLPHLHCPSVPLDRYAHLIPTLSILFAPQPKYFFALDLRQNLKLLPRLLGSVV